MNLDLSGRRAVVCGSTQGIGKACAIELAVLGASITLVARNTGRLKEVIDVLSTTSGQQHEYIAVDFSFPDDLAKAVQSYGKRNDVTILVNNTGGPPGGMIMDAKAG